MQRAVSAGTSTVTFGGAAGSTDTIAGTITFNNFVATQPGLVLQMPAVRAQVDGDRLRPGSLTERRRRD